MAAPCTGSNNFRDLNKIENQNPEVWYIYHSYLEFIWIGSNMTLNYVWVASIAHFEVVLFIGYLLCVCIVHGISTSVELDNMLPR